MNAKNAENAELGQVLRPHGVRGAMTLVPKNGLEKDILRQILKPGVSVECFSQSDHSRQMNVLEKVVFGHKIILHFQGLTNRNHLEKQLPFTVSIKEPLFLTLDSEEGVPFEWMGFQVYSYKTGDLVGKIVAIENNTRQYILEIQSKEERLLIPLIPEFVKNIDKKANSMMVLVPEWV